MESRWLEDFLSLVDTRNFSRSAEIRHTTQPAFSRRIKSLEEWVGAQLFNRATQPITLTPAGERFRTVAEDVLRRLYQGRDETSKIGEGSVSTIRFAATHSLSLNFFPKWLREVENRSHTFNTRLDTAQFNDCVHMLQRGECHFLISYTHPLIAMHLPAEHFTSKKLLEDVLIPVTLPDTAGQPIDKLPGTEEDPVHILGYSESSAIGTVVEQLLVQHEVPTHFERVFVSHMAAVLKEMSSEGRGTSWLPKSHLERELSEGSLVIAGDERWHFPIDVRLIRSRDPLPDVSEEFWRSLPMEEDNDWG